MEAGDDLQSYSLGGYEFYGYADDGDGCILRRHYGDRWNGISALRLRWSNGRRIRERAQPETFLTPDKQPKIISTMHSLGYRIISENAEKVGLSEKIRLIHVLSGGSFIFGNYPVILVSKAANT